MRRAMIPNLVVLLFLYSSAPGASRLVPGQYPTIQAAIDDCADGDTVIVAPGIYTGEGNRGIDFHGKAITVCSANAPNTCIIDCATLGRAFYFHSGESANSIVEGFTLTNGHATYGGAIYCRASSPTITNCVLRTNTAGADWSRGAGGAVFCRDSNATIANCVISGNSANKEGGGIYCLEGSPTIKHCAISANRTRRADGGGWGGGIGCEGGNAHITNCTINGNSSDSGGGLYCGHYSNAIISGCAISGNRSEYGGGGIEAGYSSPTITKCIISDNSSKYYGGGIYWYRSDPNINSCAIGGNAADHGGGAYCSKGGAKITNCTFSANSARQGKALACDSYNQEYPSDIEIGNCIFWDDGDEVWNNDSSTINITYSDVQGGWEGEGNIDTDPRLAFSGGYYLMPDSLCIDAGTNSPVGGLPAADIEGNPRSLDGDHDGKPVADMGALEYRPHRPSIAVSKLHFGFNRGRAEPQPQQLFIRNSGSGTLNWRIVEDCDWLQVSPTRGRSTGQINEVTLTVGAADNGPGLHTCSLAVISHNAINSPVTVYVSLDVPKPLSVPANYNTIQAAIDAAEDRDTIIVAPGTYAGSGNQDMNFNGKAITVRSIDPNDPNIVAATIINCNGTKAKPHRGFSFDSGEGPNSVLTGFTITNGYAFQGGAIRCYESSPTISNCNLTENVAGGGGAIQCEQGSPTITNCVIRSNAAESGAGGITCVYSSPTITDCLFTGNTTQEGPGGIMCIYSSTTILDCLFTGNTTQDEGGAISCRRSDMTIAKCTITKNTGRNGGGIASWFSSLTVADCILTQNTAASGGGVQITFASGGIAMTNCTIVGNSASHMAGGIYARVRRDSPTISNCIVWDNSHEQIVERFQPVLVRYSNIQGGWPAQGNIDLDPCFVDPGHWADANDANIVVGPNDPNAIWIGGDYHLLPTSPCMNAGDPNFVPEVNETDIDGQPRVLGGRVDMGADEFVIEVPMTLTPRAFNPCSQGKWLKAHLVLPEEFALDDVDTDTPATLRSLGTQIESEHMNVFVNEDGAVEVEAAFDRAALCEAANNSASGFLTIGVEGLFTSGRPFYGTDTIRIINHDFRCLARFVSHWLRIDCKPPDWCAGFDLNRDSAANFVDLAMLGLHMCTPRILSE